MAEEQDLIALHAAQRRRSSEEAQSSNNSSSNNNDDVSVVHDLIAGGIAGTASVLIGHPFDTIKVRKQSMLTPEKEGRTRSKLKVGSLFKGLSAPLVAASFINAMIFGSYASANRFLDDYYYYDDDDVEKEQSYKTIVMKNMICGSFAGFVQCLLICPTEHVKCRLQVASSANNIALDNCKGPLQMARGIYRAHGIDGMYRGFWATAWREVPAFAVYFAGYDYMRDAFMNRVQLEQQGEGSSTINLPNFLSSQWAASAIAGGLSGCFTWAMVYPIDVIKTRIQTGPIDVGRAHETRQILSVGSRIYKDVGIRGMFRGLGITLFRAFPVNG